VFVGLMENNGRRGLVSRLFYDDSVCSSYHAVYCFLVGFGFDGHGDFEPRPLLYVGLGLRVGRNTRGWYCVGRTRVGGGTNFHCWSACVFGKYFELVTENDLFLLAKR